MNYKNVIYNVQISGKFPNLKTQIKEYSKTNKSSLSLFEDVIYGTDTGVKKLLEEEKAKKINQKKELEKIKEIEKERIKNARIKKFLKQLNTPSPVFTTPKKSGKVSSSKLKCIEKSKIPNTVNVSSKGKPIYITNEKNIKNLINTDPKKTFSNHTMTRSTFEFTQVENNNKISFQKHKKNFSSTNAFKRITLNVEKTENYLKKIKKECNTLSNEINKNNVRYKDNYCQTHFDLPYMDKEISTDIHESLKNLPIEKIFLDNKIIVQKSNCASKINEKFAFAANKVIHEMFNKEYICTKKASIKAKEQLNNLKKKRLILRKQTDTILSDYKKTVDKCYKTLSTFT